jgi:hypothetical protein
VQCSGSDSNVVVLHSFADVVNRERVLNNGCMHDTLVLLTPYTHYAGHGPTFRVVSAAHNSAVVRQVAVH